MKNLFTAVIFALFISTSAQAQVIVKWDELNRDWFMNSAGYPSEEPRLDELYHKLSNFKLTLQTDSTYSMTFSKDSVETGKYSVDRRKKELVFTADTTGKKLAYSVAELTPDILTLLIGEKYTWAYYLSLTSHQ